MINWIIASERQPEEDGVYLVTIVRENFASVMILGYQGGWNCYRDSDGHVIKDGDMTDVVAAWMPMPEPYKSDKIEVE